MTSNGVTDNEQPNPDYIDPMEANRSSPVDLVSIRKIFISGPIHSELAADVIQSLEMMALKSSGEDIELWMNTPGGSVEDAFAIYDMMRYIPCRVHTIGIGKVMSAGLVLLAGGDTGYRSVFPSTRLMFHQLSYGQAGTITDMHISHQEAKTLQARYIDILAAHTVLSKKDLERFIEANKNLYISPQKAKTHGFIDSIRKSEKPLVAPKSNKKVSLKWNEVKEPNGLDQVIKDLV